MIWHILELGALGVVLVLQVVTFHFVRWLKRTFLPYTAAKVDDPDPAHDR
jgi:hypothetical protein